MSTMIDIARLAWDILFSIGTLVALAWSWTLRRSAADAKSLAALDAKLSRQDLAMQATVAAIDTRIGRMEERITHLPTDHDLVGVREDVARLATQISALTGEQRATTRLVENINKYLMEREK